MNHHSRRLPLNPGRDCVATEGLKMFPDSYQVDMFQPASGVTLWIPDNVTPLIYKNAVI
jgi:hypothetical protein